MKEVQRWSLVSWFVLASSCNANTNNAPGDGTDPDSSALTGSSSGAESSNTGSGGSASGDTGGSGGSADEGSTDTGTSGGGDAGSEGSGATSGTGGAPVTTSGSGGEAATGGGGSGGEGASGGSGPTTTSATGGSGGSGIVEDSLIPNGHFTNDGDGWGLETHGGDVPAIGVSGGILCLTFADVSAVTLGWPTEGEPGAVLTDGVYYTVSFRARSDPALDYFHAVAGLAVTPYTQYAQLYTTLSTEWQDYTYQILGNDLEIGLAFNLQITGPTTFCIDDIVLVATE